MSSTRCLRSLTLAVLALGCGGGGASTATAPDDPPPDSSPPSQATFTSLALTPASTSVTVGATVQLTGAALDQNGNPIAGLPAPTFTSSDPGIATITDAGLVTGVAVGTATITASLTASGVTRTATSTITVTTAAPPPPSRVTVTTPERTFSPEMVTIAVGGTVTWRITDNHHDITFLGAAPPGGSIPELDEGESASRTFPEAGTYHYECTRHRDEGMVGTVIVTAGGEPPPPPPPPPGGGATVTTPGTSFSPSTVTIAPNGTVTWQISGATHNVTFQGAAPPGGNIPDTDPGNSASRTFPSAGIFNYVCTRHNGMAGSVVVQ